MSHTYPVRDLSPVQVRQLIDGVATVRAYDTPEQTEPSITLTGIIAALAVTARGEVVIIFNGSSNPPQPLGPNEPVTVEVDFPLSMG